jgi:2-dehydropantoate 2-reductase
MDAFTIVGAGGIGSAVGYALRRSGAQVTFLESCTEKVAWGRAHGVSVDSLVPLSAEFQLFAEWTPRPGTLVLLCTKCFHNAAVLAHVDEDVDLIPIQNGFDAQLEARVAVEGIASFVSECTPGRTHTRLTRAGRLHLGGRGGRPLTERHRVLAERLRQADLFRVELVDDVLPYKHTKLMYNAAIGPLAAAAGLDNGQLLSVPLARRLFFALLRENYTILHEAGIPLGKIGPFQPRTVQKILRRPWVARLLSWAFYPSLRGSYCSMNGDLPAGVTE